MPLLLLQWSIGHQRVASIARGLQLLSPLCPMWDGPLLSPTQLLFSVCSWACLFSIVVVSSTGGHFLWYCYLACWPVHALMVVFQVQRATTYDEYMNQLRAYCHNGQTWNYRSITLLYFMTYFCLLSLPDLHLGALCRLYAPPSGKSFVPKAGTLKKKKYYSEALL